MNHLLWIIWKKINFIYPKNFDNDERNDNDKRILISRG